MKAIGKINRSSSMVLRSAVIGVCLVALGACAGLEVQSARNLDPSGTDFTKNLYSGYLGLSEDEFTEYDYHDSDGFAMKAKSAANGSQVMPAVLGEWDIPEGNVGELSGARTRLLLALNASGRTKSPESAARAQVMFDCWVQEQEENRQPDDIAACRNGFYSSIIAVEVALRPAEEPPMVAVPEPAPAAEPMMDPIPAYFVIYFDFDSAQLSADARSTIREAANAAKKMRPSKILIYGHADRAGSLSYNARLAEKRARSVTKALINEGGGRFVIDVEEYGETRPAAKTTDNIRDGRNRRVEITLEK